MRHRLSGFLLAAMLVMSSATAEAQVYTRFAVPDTALVPTLQANRAEYENLWNALLVSWLGARVAGADSAARLGALAARIAAAEAEALGSRIASEAFARLQEANVSTLRRRIAAGETEALAIAARDRRDAGAADSLFRLALAAYRALGERRREAVVLGSLGGVALSHGRYLEADSINRIALAARRALGDESLVGRSLVDLGQVNIQLQRHGIAQQYLEEARVIRERLGQLGALGTCLQFLGTVMAAQGKPDSAWPHFERAILLTSQTGDSIRTLDALINYAAKLIDYALDDRVMRLHERAIPLARQLDRKAVLATLELNQGELLLRQGRFSEAIESFESTIGLRKALKDPRSLAVALNGLGRTWLLMGDPRPAKTAFEEALALADSLGVYSLRAMTLVNLALLARTDENLDEATRQAARALSVAEATDDSRRVREAAIQLGNIALERGDLAVAERWFQRALVNSRAEVPEERPFDLLNLALARQLANRLDEAEGPLREALESARRVDRPSLLSMALFNLGDVAERRGDFAQAFDFYLRAQTITDTMRVRQHSETHAIAAFGSRLEPYEGIIHLLGKLHAAQPESGYAARAFLWAERARARVLLERSASAGPSSELVGIEGARALLPTSRTALLYYSTGDSSTSLWAIRQEGWRHFVLSGRPSMRSIVRALRHGFTDAGTDPRHLRAAQHLCYKVLIGPAEQFLAGIDELIVAPDGPLALLPFETLLMRPAPGATVPKGAYLVERYAVSYAPSASVLAALGRRIPGGKLVVAVGNPRFEGAVSAALIRGIGGVALAAAPDTGADRRPMLASLPGTRRELDVLRELGRNRGVKLLEGSEATRARLVALDELPQAAVLHIGTHGLANELEPERSGLWLAPDKKGGGASFLSVADVRELKLDAEQVTLSACETAVGRVERGEGVIGLARAFLSAGARSVLVSQWRVPDRTTADLMERFYRGVLVEGKSRAQALAEAKRALLLRAETRAALHWAPFVLVGTSGPLRPNVPLPQAHEAPD